MVETCTYEYTAREVGWVYADEGIRFTGVATELDGTWIRRKPDCQICREFRKIVWIFQCAAVPMVWNSLLASVPLERSGLATDAKERLEVVAVEIA
jgi:hypothetical protein